MLKSWLLKLSRFLVPTAIFVYYGTTVSAQNITLDGSLGTSGTLTGHNYAIPQSLGQTVGNNLFHSFSQFNLNSNEAAIFQTNPNIQNIFSRVTGGNQSVIDGLISTQSGVNLFFINPSGIIFGKNARLDVGRSFVASTATALQFGNLGYFSATEKNVPSPLLTINPSAFLFNQLKSAPIVDRSMAPAPYSLSLEDALGLRVPDGKSLMFVGGDINIDGGRLNAFGGRVELGGLQEKGTVGLNVDGDKLSLNFTDGVRKADVSLLNTAIVDVTGGGGGNIAITGQNLNILEGSSLRAGIGTGLGSVGTKAGNININMNDKVNIQAADFPDRISSDELDATDFLLINTFFPSQISNRVNQGAVGDGGDIIVKARTLSLLKGAQISTSTFAKGNSGNIFANVSDSISAEGKIYTYSLGNGSGTQSGGGFLTTGGKTDVGKTGVELEAVGKAGNINVIANSLSMTNGAGLNSIASERENAGSISMLVDKSIFFQTEKNQPGLTGVNGARNLNIATKSLLLDNARLNNLSGLLSVQADAVSLRNSGIDASGGINMHVGQLSLQENSQIWNYSVNNSGISIKADSISLDDNSNLFNNEYSLNSSNQVLEGGSININTNSIFLTNFSNISASNYYEGNPGNINIDATNRVLIDNSKISTDVGSPRSDSGKINIRTPDLELKNSSAVKTDIGLSDIGNSGDITIQADKVSLTKDSLISTQTSGQGNAGNIKVESNGSVSAVNSLITSRVIEGEGNSGNIKIKSRSLSLLDGAEIQALVLRGKGNAGQIDVSASDWVNISGVGKAGFSETSQVPVGGESSGLFTSTEAGAIGSGGEIKVSTNALRISNGGVLSARSRNAFQGGNITVNVNNLEITDGGQILTTTFGSGNAGTITINATDSITLSGSDTSYFDRLAQFGRSAVDTVSPQSGIFASTQGLGSGGDIAITTKQLVIRDGAQISASAGSVGNLSVIDEFGDAGDLLSTSQTGEEQPTKTPVVKIQGQLGNDNKFGYGEDVDMYKIFITGDGTFSAKTLGVTKLDTALFLFNANGIGIYGNDDALPRTVQSTLPSSNPLTPTTPGIYYLAISKSGYNPRSSEGFIFDSAHFGTKAPDGLGKSLPLSGWDYVNSVIDESGSYTINLTGSEFATKAPKVGSGGNITINANTLEAIKGGQILTTTRGSGNAGKTTLNIKDSVNLSGLNTGIFANTFRESTGGGGDIKIATGQLTVRDGAQITASSQGLGDAGNISNIAASTIKLNNGAITTTSTGGEGGNIKLQVRDLLLLRNHSQISSTAGTEYSGGGNGGNIMIETPFIVGTPNENSDITANAFDGKGGTVSIKANNIFGMTVRSREDLVELLRTRKPQDLDPEKLPTNDITAISHTSPTLSGQVLISTPDVDPSRGLIELPTNLVDTSQQIAQVCTPRNGQTASRFISTGRGGIPENPYEPLRKRAVINNWVTLPNNENQQTREIKEEMTAKSTSKTIVEAQGWLVNPRGEVELVALPTDNSHNFSQQATFSCNAAKSF